MVQERFRAYVFRGPPPGPALAFCSERLASTPGGREHGIDVVGTPVRFCAGRGAHAGRKSHGRGLCITNGKASCAAWCVLFLGGAGVCLGAGIFFYYLLFPIVSVRCVKYGRSKSSSQATKEAVNRCPQARRSHCNQAQLSSKQHGNRLLSPHGARGAIFTALRAPRSS
jgi:hypothetical protein